MTKILLTAVLAAAGITLVLQALWQGAEASMPPPSAASASFSLVASALPSPRDPFDLTPITPVESTGASMDAE